MARHLVGNFGQCIAYEAIARKALGLPIKGTHVGGGRHVAIPDTPPGPGWTTGWAEPRKHPSNSNYAVRVLVGHAENAALNASEQAQMNAAEQSAVHLDSSWDLEE